MTTHSKEHRLDNIESLSSQVRAARKVLKEAKRHFPKDIDMHKLRTGKTIYFFKSKQRMNAFIQDDTDYDYAEPGQLLPSKKIRL